MSDRAERRARRDRWLARIGAVLLRLLALTWRMRYVNTTKRDALHAAKRPFIHVLWHGEMLPLLWAFRDQGVAILISEHGDGEIIARAAMSLGYNTVRGSSSRNADRALLALTRVLVDGGAIAVTPDGPRGPAEQVKPGALYLAERTGRRMVPIGVAADRTRAFRSWDRFRVPWPFARVLVSHGAPFAPPHSLTAPLGSLAGSSESGLVANSAGSAAAAAEAQVEERDLEPARLAFERALDTLTRDVRVRVGERI